MVGWTCPWYTHGVQTFLLTVGTMGFLMMAMAIGVIVQRKELKGSCGGIGGACACENAGRPGACDPNDPLRSTSAVMRPPGEITHVRMS